MFEKKLRKLVDTSWDPALAKDEFTLYPASIAQPIKWRLWKHQDIREKRMQPILAY